MRSLATLIVVPILSGCALLQVSSMSGSMSFTDPAGYRITCNSGPVQVASGDQSFEIDAHGCTTIAEAGGRTFLAQHPGATIDSMTVEAGAVVSVCYTLDGTSACATVAK